MTSVTVPARVTSTGFGRAFLRAGGLAGVTMMFVSAIGMVETFDGRFVINPILSVGFVILFSSPFFAGFLVARRGSREGEISPPPAVALVNAAGAGLIAGVMTGGFIFLVESVPGIRGTLPKLSTTLVDTVTFGNGATAGFGIIVGASLAIALLAGIIALTGDRMIRALAVGTETVVILAMFEAVVTDLFDWFPTVPDLIYASGGGLTPASALVLFALGAVLSWTMTGKVPSLRSFLAKGDQKARARRSLITALIVIAIFVVLPQFLGGVLNELLTNVGLFLLMGLGLNIVVGMAGLLDLGYVAFFAVGAYTTAVLTSPLSPMFNPELSWWLAFPVVLVMAGIAGIMVGTPVIRMRGDYLAIVTLGFGEIVRLLLLSDWLSPVFGGAQGIRNIPGIPVGGTEINATTPDLFIYATLALVLLAAYISWRLQDSRIGRAWAAMREDEDVAEAMGVDTVKAKLLAFIIGAILASFAGALFSAKVGSVFTNSFEILVSIVILVIVIVGGMGSIPGVAVGALVLVGVLGGPNQPGLLQEFGEYKLLIYGALLVYMMLRKPEGLIPSARRAQELHQEEYLQDAWLDKDGALTETAGEPA